MFAVTHLVQIRLKKRSFRKGKVKKMIINVRVDHRLLHGQVGYSWVTYLGADCLLVANDDIMTDDLKKTAVYMAKPTGVKLVMKDVADSISAINKGVTDKYKLMVIVGNVHDAYLLSKNCPSIKELTLGNMFPRKEARKLDKTFNVLPDEEKELLELQKSGIQIVIQRVPETKAIKYEGKK